MRSEEKKECLGEVMGSRGGSQRGPTCPAGAPTCKVPFSSRHTAFLQGFEGPLLPSTTGPLHVLFLTLESSPAPSPFFRELLSLESTQNYLRKALEQTHLNLPHASLRGRGQVCGFSPQGAMSSPVKCGPC